MTLKKSRNRKSISLFSSIFVLFISCFGMFILLSRCTTDTHEYTRGIGIYPGDVKEDFSPATYIDKKNYRNLAFHKPAYHSSSYDYNLTAQLVTDGIKDTGYPNWFSASTSQHGTLKKNEREWLIDHNAMTSVSFEGSGGWMQIEMGGGDQVPEVDRISISGMLTINDQVAKGWECIVSGSDDGQTWKGLGRTYGRDYPGETFRMPFRRPGPIRFRIFNQSIGLKTPSYNRFYRVDFKAQNVIRWNIGGMDFYHSDNQVEIAPSHIFTSAWMSAGNEEEWVYVDLGAVCKFDQIDLYWIRRAAVGSIQVSDDAFEWKDIQDLSASEELTDKFRFDSPVEGRYVRVLMKEPASSEGYLMSEMEVFGRGGPVAKPKPSPAIKHNGRMDLAGGAWRVQRESLVSAEGETLSKPGFQDSNWVIATVPGTVLISYRNAGALPDPNYGDNQLMISESFFYSDFWYRNEFLVPDSYEGQHMYINFDGINWKAEVFLNGRKIGRVEGAFTRGQFDVTNILIPGQKNALAVRIIKNATPGNVKEQTALSPDKNGGALGADNPTYHASIGWDWIPTIRGRNTGIWNDVFLTISGPVTIENPFITTILPLPDTSQADVNIELTLRNHEPKVVSGVLHGHFGEVVFKQPVTLEASAAKNIKLNPSTHPALLLQNPKLWWPAGYGDPNLYDVELRFESEDKTVSDVKSFQSGVRQMTYSEEGGILKIWINGRRFIGRGGNWGFPESNLCYRGREYDIAVRYHSDMNFTMIRNWVGQTGDDEFYEACDRHGIMVWQDFWLANPVDGPNPDDNEMFMRNVEDIVLRIRNHPSMALYVGRNEGNPPEVLDTAIRKIIPGIHPGLHYISNSAFGVVSGGGHYRALPAKFYFETRATTKLHSEMGMPNIVTYESLKKMMPDSAMWPQGRMWGLHDFCLEGAQGGEFFLKMMDINFGEINNVKDWVSLAQWRNYEGYRAMFEAQSKYRMGLLLWMSHPAWPSFVWQTYDYYFEPTAAYFACKKASEPLHIQWNPLSDTIEVVNYSAGNVTGLTASVEIRNLDGTVQWEKSASLESTEDSNVPCIKMEYPSGLTDVFFLRLKLAKGDEILSENFYWRGLDKNNEKLPGYRFYNDLEESNYQALHNLPKVDLESSTRVDRKGDIWYLTTHLNNPSEHPVLMVRLKVVREKSGDRILPVLYSDNYVSLMPGEQRTIQMELEHADTRGEKPGVVITGFNIEKVLE